MKKFFATSILFFSLFAVGCVSTGVVPANDPTSQKLVIAASITEDTLAMLLPPVLSKNPGYIDAAKGIAAACAAFTGDAITVDSVVAVLVKSGVSDADSKLVAGIVIAAWESYDKHYKDALGVAVRPDVKLFLQAVSRGVERAVTYVPSAQRAQALAPK
jgi:hypothetical protein